MIINILHKFSFVTQRYSIFNNKANIVLYERRVRGLVDNVLLRALKTRVPVVVRRVVVKRMVVGRVIVKRVVVMRVVVEKVVAEKVVVQSVVLESVVVERE